MMTLGAHDEADPDQQTLLFEYPSSISVVHDGELGYIRPVVKIEFGARSDHWPSTQQTIIPYAAEVFPEFFQDSKYTLKVLDAERTFWDKATILHREFNRTESSEAADRISRHYYDLYKLAGSPIGENALNQLDLLNRVIKHQMVFFAKRSANYDAARSGSLHLVPAESSLPTLRADYGRMRDMFFGEIPTFEEITNALGELELRINALVVERIRKQAVRP